MRYTWLIAALMLTAAGATEGAMHHVTGPFDVTVTPADDPVIAAMGAARWAIAKTYTGPLAATARAVMLSAGSPAAGSAGYAAIERIDGILAGRAGSFTVVHTATMNEGSQAMQVIVVPGSGTGALTGITGTMTIRVDGGKHFYDLDYDLAP